MEDPSGETRYDYDDADRLVRVTDPDNAVVRYGYDTDGRRTSLQSEAGTIGYAYNAAGALLDVTHPGGGHTRYGYDLAGNQTSAVLPNATREQRTYDDRDRVVRIRHLRPDDSVIGDYAYTLSPTGQRVAVQEHGGRAVTYRYDPLTRLVGEEATEPGASDIETSYTYDAVGNRLTRTAGSTSTDYTYDANDRLLTEGATAYDYDTNGNLVRRSDGSQSRSFMYDAMNHLRSTSSGAETAQFRYDADGNRIASTAGGKTTKYLLDTAGPLSRVVQERPDDGSPAAGYVFGNELLSQQRGTDTSYYQHDAAGSTRALTNAGGNVTDTYDYDAFGNDAGTSGSTANDIRYAGEQLEPQLGTYNLRARHYDPATGRFVSLDPQRTGDLELPVAQHKYLYAGSDPVNRTDPTGRDFSLGGLSVGLSIGFDLASIALPTFFGSATPIVDPSGHATPGGNLGQGRRAAAAFLKTFPPGTCGAVMAGPVEAFEMVMGDFASATIGQHYRDVAASLAQPATPQALMDIAVVETAYWNQQTGWAWVIGASVPAWLRYGILYYSAWNLGIAGF